MTDTSYDKITITLTKEQWEEVYQWYLIADEEYHMNNLEHEAAKHIADTLIKRYGTFR